MVVPIQVKVMLPLRDHSLGPQFVLYRWLYGPHACYSSIYLHAALLLPHDAYFLTWPLSWLVPWTTILSSLPRPILYLCVMTVQWAAWVPRISTNDLGRELRRDTHSIPSNKDDKYWGSLVWECVCWRRKVGGGGDKDCMHLIIQSKSRCACVWSIMCVGCVHIRKQVNNSCSLLKSCL